MSFLRLISLAFRESLLSRRRLFLFLSAISLGVAAITAVQGFAANLTTGIESQARAILGADLKLESNKPFSARSQETIDAIVAGGAVVANVTSFVAMAYHVEDGSSRLAHVRAPEAGFPFYGAVHTRPGDSWARLQSGKNAVVDPVLLTVLDAAIGDEISLGQVDFRIVGTIERMPGDLEITSLFAPRVFIPARYLEETELLEAGSRAEYATFVRLPRAASAESLVQRYRTTWLSEHVRSRTVASQQRQVDDALRILTGYLGLIGVFALLLGGVGVASALNVYMARKAGTVAVFRCLGATSGQVLTIYLLQTAALGLAGAVVGVVIGISAQWLLPLLIADLLPVDVGFRTDMRVVITGLIVGLAASLAFAMLALLRVRTISPLVALRRNQQAPRGEPVSAARLTLWALLAAGSFLVIVLHVPSPSTGVFIATGIGLTLLVLRAAAGAITALLRRVQPANLPYTLRLGIANLYRPGNQTATTVLALGFGVLLLATLMLTQANVLRPLLAATSGQANLILLDVQPDQVEPLQKHIEERDAVLLESVPLVSMRIHAINGERISRIASERNETGGLLETSEEDWVFFHEYRSTYRPELSDTEKLVAGTWWTSDTKPAPPYAVSLSSDIANMLDVSIGDRIDWSIQGVVLPTIVRSLRKVDLAKLAPNFAAVFEPAALVDAPQVWLLLARGEGGSQRADLQLDVARDYPNVSVIDVTVMQQTLREIVARVSLVFKALATISIATGFIVLLGTVATGQIQRIRDSVILKTLGATRGQIGQTLFTEYAVLGVLASLVGVGISLLAAWGLARHLLDIAFVIEVIPLTVLTAGIAITAGIVGTSGSLGAFRGTAIDAMRFD